MRSNSFIAGTVLADKPYSQQFCPDVCLSTVFIYLTWRRNGFASFGEIWQAGRTALSCISVLEKIGPQTS